jgi:hypothetical protein
MFHKFRRLQAKVYMKGKISLEETGKMFLLQGFGFPRDWNQNPVKFRTAGESEGPFTYMDAI